MRMKLFGAVVALTMASMTTVASNSTAPVTIAFINYTTGGKATVYVQITPGTSAPITGIPACVSPQNIGNTYDYVFDDTTAAGKALLAGLIAAHASGATIWITGTGDCNLLGGNESLLNFLG